MNKPRLVLVNSSFVKRYSDFHGRFSVFDLEQIIDEALEYEWAEVKNTVKQGRVDSQVTLWQYGVPVANLQIVGLLEILRYQPVHIL